MRLTMMIAISLFMVEQGLHFIATIVSFWPQINEVYLKMKERGTAVDANATWI